MEPIRRDNVVSGSDFVHQIKWDGIRGVAFIENGKVSIYTKKGAECTNSYPELISLPEKIYAKSAVIDGELIAFDNGKPSFYTALKRNRTLSAAAVQRASKLYPIKYVVFDILFKDGHDLRGLPLYKRQEILAKAVEQDKTTTLNESFDEGQALFELMRQQNMEGIVSKRINSSYIPGKKHSDWFKTKTAKKMLCAVIGISFKNSLPASLMLGILRDGEMQHIGNVSSGLSQSDITALTSLEKAQNTRRQEESVLIEPDLTCWVKFSEWTNSGTLRHPVLLGFSEQQASEAKGSEISV